jgi:tetratricopeptide (TPR) repeat protein
MELDTTSPRPYNNRGLAYADQGNLARALADYSKAIELNPNFAAAYFNRGALYREQGQKTQAIADLEKYLELDSNLADRAQVEAWLQELRGQ